MTQVEGRVVGRYDRRVFLENGVKQRHLQAAPLDGNQLGKQSGLCVFRFTCTSRLIHPSHMGSVLRHSKGAHFSAAEDLGPDAGVQLLASLDPRPSAEK